MKKNIAIAFLYCIFCGCSIFDDCNDHEESDDIVFAELPNPYAEKTSSEFISVFGDIQYYTTTENMKLFKYSLDWIEYENRLVNILCTLHTGDIVQVNTDRSEWASFDSAISDFSKSIPFISCIGDHDYTWHDNIYIDSRYETNFSEHTKFPLVTNRIEAAFESGRMENIIVRNEIHGKRVDLLLLEFGPRKEVVKWAYDWVASHPDIKYILMNHEYLEQGGGRRQTGLKCKARLRNTTYTTPNELWDNLIKKLNNIVCVLCGHVGGLYAVTYEKNDFGREVCQIEHNIQGSPYKYENWVMMWEFPVDSEDAVVSIVNARTGELFESKDTLFTFKYRY